MEARKITIISNNSSSRKEIMSTAVTLGDLKTDLHQNDVNYDGMAFYEGRSRTELKDNASILPTNVPLANKGTTTNELVFMLTTENKKIKSGAMSRSEVYAAIKAQNLQDAVKAKFGKNFTQVSTADLEAMLGGSSTSATKAKEEVPATEDIAPKEADIAQAGTVDIEARQLLVKVLDILANEDELEEDYDKLHREALMLVYDSEVEIPEDTQEDGEENLEDLFDFVPRR